MQLYQYAVIKNEKLNKDGEIVDEASLVVPITELLARDEDQAMLLAARQIPEDELTNIDRLVVALRPF